MALTLGNLQTLVLSWLDDPDGTYFTSAQTKVWLNQAQKEVQKRLINLGDDYYVQKMSGTLVVDQDNYVLPTDFKKCHFLEIVVDGTAGATSERRAPMLYRTLSQLNTDGPQGTGRPFLYNIRKNILTVRPIPDSTYTIYLHQSYLLADMVNSGDLPDVPEDYREYIAVLATLDGFLKDQRDPSAFVMAKQTKYEKMLEESAKGRDVSQPRMVIETETW